MRYFTITTLPAMHNCTLLGHTTYEQNTCENVLAILIYIYIFLVGGPLGRFVGAQHIKFCSTPDPPSTTSLGWLFISITLRFRNELLDENFVRCPEISLEFTQRRNLLKLTGTELVATCQYIWGEKRKVIFSIFLPCVFPGQHLCTRFRDI